MKVKKYFNFNLFAALRRRKKITQTALADILGVALTSVTDWETGKTRPHMDNIHKIAEYFEVDWTLFVSKAEQIAWQHYQLGVLLAHGTHDDHRTDAVNLNALPQYQPEDEEPSEAQNEDDDLLAESETPQV